MNRNKLIRQMAEFEFEEEFEAVINKIRKREDELRAMSHETFNLTVVSYGYTLIDRAKAK
jgi:hypothetical protein